MNSDPSSPSSSSSSHPYQVLTSRGTILARHVVHANNAFAPRLIPGLKGKMSGFLAHMSSQRPGGDLPDLDGRRSWSVMYDGNMFDYVTQRPSEGGRPGDLLLGGGFSRSSEQGIDAVGVFDDSRVDALPSAHLFGIFPAIFEPRWGSSGSVAAAAKRVWTGIVALTGDMRPFVGRLDKRLTERDAAAAGSPVAGKGAVGSSPGEWVSAGYCGDGMVWAWLCGTALGKMVLGEEVEWFPPELGLV